MIDIHHNGTTGNPAPCPQKILLSKQNSTEKIVIDTTGRSRVSQVSGINRELLDDRLIKNASSESRRIGLDSKKKRERRQAAADHDYDSNTNDNNNGCQSPPLNDCNDDNDNDVASFCDNNNDEEEVSSERKMDSDWRHNYANHVLTPNKSRPSIPTTPTSHVVKRSVRKTIELYDDDDDEKVCNWTGEELIQCRSKKVTRMSFIQRGGAPKEISNLQSQLNNLSFSSLASSECSNSSGLDSLQENISHHSEDSSQSNNSECSCSQNSNSSAEEEEGSYNDAMSSVSEEEEDSYNDFISDTEQEYEEDMEPEEEDDKKKRIILRRSNSNQSMDLNGLKKCPNIVDDDNDNDMPLLASIQDSDFEQSFFGESGCCIMPPALEPQTSLGLAPPPLSRFESTMPNADDDDDDDDDTSMGSLSLDSVFASSSSSSSDSDDDEDNHDSQSTDGNTFSSDRSSDSDSCKKENKGGLNDLDNNPTTNAIHICSDDFRGYRPQQEVGDGILLQCGSSGPYPARISLPCVKNNPARRRFRSRSMSHVTHNAYDDDDDDNNSNNQAVEPPRMNRRALYSKSGSLKQLMSRSSRSLNNLMSNSNNEKNDQQTGIPSTIQCGSVFVDDSETGTDLLKICSRSFSALPNDDKDNDDNAPTKSNNSSSRPTARSRSNLNNHNNMSTRSLGLLNMSSRSLGVPTSSDANKKKDTTTAPAARRNNGRPTMLLTRSKSLKHLNSSDNPEPDANAARFQLNRSRSLRRLQGNSNNASSEDGEQKSVSAEIVLALTRHMQNDDNKVKGRPIVLNSTINMRQQYARSRSLRQLSSDEVDTSFLKQQYPRSRSTRQLQCNDDDKNRNEKLSSGSSSSRPLSASTSSSQPQKSSDLSHSCSKLQHDANGKKSSPPSTRRSKIRDFSRSLSQLQSEAGLATSNDSEYTPDRISTTGRSRSLGCTDNEQADEQDGNNINQDRRSLLTRSLLKSKSLRHLSSGDDLGVGSATSSKNNRIQSSHPCRLSRSCRNLVVDKDDNDDGDYGMMMKRSPSSQKLSCNDRRTSPVKQMNRREKMLMMSGILSNRHLSKMSNDEIQSITPQLPPPLPSRIVTRTHRATRS